MEINKKKCCILLVLIMNMFVGLVVTAMDFTPELFTVLNIKKIKSGDVVYFEPGNYRLTFEKINALTNNTGNRLNDVIIKRKGSSGNVNWDAREMTGKVVMDFRNVDNLTIENISFRNVVPQLYQATNSTFNHCVFKDILYWDSRLNQNALVKILHGSNNSIKNSTAIWNYTEKNGKAYKIWKGENHVLYNNLATGNLRGGIDVSNGSNFKIKYNTLIRNTEAGYEDHGIYVYEQSGAVLYRNTVSGWSTQPSGGSVKIKNVDTIDINQNVFSTSGILVRNGGSSSQNRMENIKISNNEVDEGDINVWTPYSPPIAIVIIGNTVNNGKISARFSILDYELFNQYSALANRYGGVYNNETQDGLRLSDGINQSGNSQL